MIIPAIIAQTQEELDIAIHKVTNLAPRLQLDIMDGCFVPNQSLDFDFQLPQKETYEAHLMVTNPLEWIHKYGHKVDFNELAQRKVAYREHEEKSCRLFQEEAASQEKVAQ